MAEPAKALDGEAVSGIEQTVDDLIACHRGDARATVRALLIEAARLERELALTRPVVSYGFTRGWHRNRDGGR